MTAIASYALVKTSAGQRAGRNVRAVEKIKPRANFDGEYENRRQPKSWICVPYERRQPCQSGTVDDGSFWDGPRLKSEFAAQVLGQAMAATDAPTTLRGAAYRKPAFVLLPLFNKNI